MGSSKKVKPSQLGDVLGNIIKEYSDDVVKALPDAVKKAAQDGVKALKASAAGAVGGTKYKGSFKSKKTAGTADTTEYTIYSDRYQVAHLLEHGHAIRNQYGVYGVSPAHPHWITAEEKAIKALEEEIQKKVEEAG